ncbi:hypothetical protein AAVH_08984 [Aphelenchoides avenae]|nr:hypothetical protein AAVH_08984 [Aphelenchus avenae]
MNEQATTIDNVKEQFIRVGIMDLLNEANQAALELHVLWSRLLKKEPWVDKYFGSDHDGLRRFIVKKLYGSVVVVNLNAHVLVWARHAPEEDMSPKEKMTRAIHETLGAVHPRTLLLSDFCERLKKKEPSSGTYFEGSHEKVREFIEENLQLTVDVKQIHGKTHVVMY